MILARLVFLTAIDTSTGWRPFWILKIWRPRVAPVLAPIKNQNSMTMATYWPKLVLWEQSEPKYPF